MQAQLSGQCISLPDRSSFPTWGSSRSWQSDADVNLRRRVIEIIAPIFQKCRHQLPLEWQQKIPDLVTTVEQALYNEASSKEEYADFRTLEQRLQIMTPKFVNNTGTQQQHRNTNPLDDLSSALIGNSNNNMVNSMGPTPGFSNNMMPTPGSNGTVRNMMPTPGLNTNKTTNSNMIPTPGGIGNFVQTSTGMFQVNGMRMMHDAASAGFSTGSMQMMPTPGISMPQQTAVSSGNFPKSSDMSMNSIQPQQYPTANGHMVRKPLNAGGGLTNGMMVNRNHLVNGHDYPVQSMQGQSHFQNQSQFLLQQQQQQRLSRMQQMTNSMNATANGSYAMNAADLAGNANIYTSTGLISNGMALNTVNPQLKLPLNSVHQSQNIVHQQMQQSLQQQRLQQQQLQPQQQQQQQQQQSVPLQRQEHPTFQISEKKPEIQNVSIDIPMPDQQPQQQQSSPQIQEKQQVWQQAKSENHVTPQNNELVQAKPEPIQPMEDVKPDVKQEPEQAQPVKQEQGSLPMVSTPGAENNNGGQQVVSSMRAQQYQKQQRWLLFLHHASKCKAPAGSCTHNPHCGTGKQLLSHIARCRTYECTYERCPASRKLLFHHQKCRDINCPVCGRVRQLILKHQSREPSPREGVSSIQPPSKRVKVEPVPDSTNIHEYSENHPMKSEPSKPSKMNVKTEAQTVKPEAEVKPNIPVVNNEVINGKGLKPKTIGASLTELFTVEQIRQHITSLRQWVGQSKSKVEKIQAMEHQSNEQACRLCGVEKLFFDPPPIYCTTCGIRVKRNALYYTTAIRDTRHYFCIPCYNDVRTENVELEGLTYPKNVLEKHKHDEEQEEAWVCCERCNLWQHQICSLFNSRRNEGGEADYTCPQCCMAEMERGERLPLPESALLGAKDLPKTYLSDHLEKRLTEKLRQERLERARAQGKSFDEVPGAEGLVVRVVSSVDKKLEVKPRFLEIFQEEDYPTEFPYKSKAVLLFQRIEGVEVCLYGMYVQEFGVESAQPNERRVYLSYLDSVKYFRPEVKTLHGEALRTYVYHELLVGYLDYCKRRGFTSCYIWACPPLKGEDYILYCHPEIQKTPKSDKLREWYLTMLRKASRDNIVVDVTNFYDYFFVSQGECKAKVTAARLPYFDGDYWPGAAEDIILQLQQQQDSDDGNKQKKGKIKKPPTKRNTKTAAAAEMGVNASKDTQLMLKLGESIMPMKEDFIMVHLYHTCTHCRNFILSGYRWICRVCKTFQLCDRCYDADVKLDERERHPFNNKEVHHLSPVAVDEVSGDTKDKDDIMESEFFDTRHAFLTLCQGNHYQYDTLRRAKHSSMMVLYHLHNPMAPAFVTTCSICNHDIETGQGWKCDTCTEYDVCNGCYQEEGRKHPHRLIPHPSASERNAQNKEARQQRMLQLKKMLELLVHASNCGTQQCQYPMCVNVKRLFRHGGTCPKRVSGNCLLCKRMWNILQIHARTCKESQCRVPRCKDLKEHLRRSILQMESRRRAAVMEMMRQRTAETTGRKQ